jgi:hypothetical protein
MIVMRRHFSLLALALTSVLFFSACAFSKLSRLENCEFRSTTLEQTQLAGVNVQGYKSVLDFKFTDALKVADAYKSGKMPLSFILNVEARNPNSKPALMAKIDWIALIDDDQIALGTVDRAVQIPAGGTAIIPFTVQTDLLELLKGKSKDALITYAMGLAGADNKPLRVAIKVKPYISIGKKTLAYPGFFKLEQEFSAD